MRLAYLKEEEMKTKVLAGWLALLFCLAIAPAFALKPPAFPKTGKDPSSFVLPGFFLLKEARGDLNKDGQEDAALILASQDEKSMKPGDPAPPRYLLLLLKSPEGYALSAMSSDIVLKKDDGGMMGDPFQDLSISKGSVVLMFYGGSRDRWDITYRFRYQNGDWYLIGKTLTDFDALSSKSNQVDINYSTGTKVTTVVSEKGQKKTASAKLSSPKLWKLSELDGDNRFQRE